jgi:hypothetical protein
LRGISDLYCEYHDLVSLSIYFNIDLHH